ENNDTGAAVADPPRLHTASPAINATTPATPPTRATRISHPPRRTTAGERYTDHPPSVRNTHPVLRRSRSRKGGAMLAAMNVIEQARQRGYQLDEKPLEGRWVWAWHPRRRLAAPVLRDRTGSARLHGRSAVPDRRVRVAARAALGSRLPCSSS